MYLQEVWENEFDQNVFIDFGFVFKLVEFVGIINFRKY